MHIIQSAIGLVYAVFGIISFVVDIRVVFEKFRIYDLIRELAANRAGISYYCPLRFAEQAKHLTHIMNETGQHKPVGMTVCTNSFCCLQQVLRLVKINIRIGIVHQGIQEFHGVPYRHFLTVKLEELILLFLHKIVSLVFMVETVKLTYSVPARRLVVTKLLFSFGGLSFFRITF